MPTPPPSSAARVNLSDRIRSTLEGEIASGRLAAGTRVEETTLMSRFGVSRTPAREAMLQLLSAGLLTSVPRQGTVVSSVSLPDYVAMLEILVELESLAARLAARRMLPAERRALADAADACTAASRSGDATAYAQANRTFHETLYDGSHNPVLARQLRSMRSRMRHPQDSVFDRPGRLRNSLAEHDAVVQAILTGDEDAAYRAMTAHISSGGNVFADSIATMAQAPSRQVAAGADA